MYKQDDFIDKLLRLTCGALGAFLLFVITGKLWLWLFGAEYAQLHQNVFISLALASLFIGWIVGYELMKRLQQNNAKELRAVEELLRKTDPGRLRR